jgi:hypothetical protein
MSNVRTVGDVMKDVLACTTKDEARALIRTEVGRLLIEKPQLLPEEARSNFLTNVGYMTGYYSRDTAARILDLFETRHPYFGAIEDWPKTTEETVSMGFHLGNRKKQEARKA